MAEGNLIFLTILIGGGEGGGRNSFVVDCIIVSSVFFVPDSTWIRLVFVEGQKPIFFQKGGICLFPDII